MARNENLIKYKEFELEDDYTIRQNEEFCAILKDGIPQKVFKRSSNVYNQLFDFIQLCGCIYCI